MKQTILDVLENFAAGQPNLGSSAARETIASIISAALKTKGVYTEYGDDEDYPYHVIVESMQAETKSKDTDTTYSIVENLGWSSKDKKQKKIGEITIFEGEIK
jgi:hypothetical protein